MTDIKQAIRNHLKAAGEATAKQIAKAIGASDYPSRVINALSEMRTDTEVESELHKGKGSELWHRLVLADTKPIQPAPKAKPAKEKPSTVAKTTAAQPPDAPTPEAEDHADNGMPPADPALLASANRMLGERLEGVAHALRGSGLLALREVSGSEDLQQHVAALSGAYQMALAELELRTDSLSAACAALGKIGDRLGVDPDAGGCGQIFDALDRLHAKDAATGYLVKAPKRRPRVVINPESARATALAAAKHAGRSEVFALVRVGVATRKQVKAIEYRELAQ